MNFKQKIVAGICYVRIVPKIICIGVLFLQISAGVNAGNSNAYNSAGPYRPIEVKGKIVDEKMQPLVGATIAVKDRKIAATTDSYGNFVLKGVDENAYLLISFIGYENQEIKLHSKTFLLIKMTPVTSKLGDVVVVGYGLQKKANLIGSVSQLTAKEVNNRPITALSNALTGQMAGVTVIQRSGQPGASGGEIQIRGVGSFGANPAALILVDGIPVNSFNDIDPNDVENISILKDASTAAIYGSRAANGVILVTTKTGKNSQRKIKLSYNGYEGMQRATAYPQFVSSWEYASLLNEAQPGSYTDEQIQKFKDGTDPDNYPNENYIKDVLKTSTFQTGHNISISNNTANTQYSLSLGSMYQNGIVIKNRYNRYNLRFNMINQLTSKLKLTSRVSGAQYLDAEPAPPATLDFTGMLINIREAVRTPAIYVNKLSNGDYGLGVVGKGTPVSYLENESFFKSKQADLLLNLKLDWDILAGLRFSIIGGYTELLGNSQRFLSTQRLNSTVTLGPGNLNQSNNDNSYKTLQELLEYKKAISKHQLGVLIGHSYEYNQSASVTGSRSGYYSNSLTQLNAGDAGTQKNSGSASEFSLDSYFGRLNYNYSSRYLAEVTVRYDGSSRFPPNSKYATFPAAAVGWRISDERFLKDKISWLVDLKLKASYGILGNQEIGNYSYQNVYTSGYNYPIGGVLSTGVANLTLADPTIKWESTRTKDVGMDATFLEGKLDVSATYFDRYTYDILVSPASSVSTVLGKTVGVQNSGKLSNKGWEFTLGFRDNIGNFTFAANANFSVIRNTVLDLGVGDISQPNGLVGNGSTLFVGYPMNLYYGYKADKIFKDAADIAGYADQKSVNPTVKPGDIRYVDISGPNGHPDGKVDATYDRCVLGSQIPKYSYGVNLTAGYKGFDLAVLLQGVAGVNGYLDGWAGFAFNANGNIQRYQADSHWSVADPDPNAKYPRLETAGSPNQLLSSFWMLNAGYLKVRNVQLGYKFSEKSLKANGIENLRIYLTAQNPFAIKHYPTGWDPEINTGGQYYPIMEAYTFGINVNF
ncbi:MAG TPA: TonB-dependent receptor [Puia sp.]|jgi:TonB-linked SusC/RagA family outer membrane protein